ncbi:uncharacterized protein LOC121237962 [Juglans microcarpa x Juglans regia]|uniref:uncharacterized protein LOC121237962 n=1 Tax=Juglans microcarpa x Juglans regia TaxID=2249226 RepID=UPI001B7F7701|nr:uncharacterized protein LOC121237962 [Juglans microcarpa x Juglans regia]
MEKSAGLLPWVKTFILIILLHLICSSSVVRVNGLEDAMELRSSSKVMIQMNKVRKLMGVEALLDYEDPSANPTHDPKKGSPGGKGGNNP